MPKLEILLKDGGVSETETMPVGDNARNQAAPNQAQAQSNFMNNALLLGAAKVTYDASVSQIGFATGDVALERKIKGISLGTGLAFGLSTGGASAVATGLALGISQASEAWVRAKTISRKHEQVLQNQKLTGAIAVNNSIYGGAQ